MRVRNRTRHPKLPLLADKGYLELERFEGSLDPVEWEQAPYLAYRSGGETRFAVLASANGEEDPGPYWNYSQSDKDARWTRAAENCPGLVRWAEEIDARLGRVRLIKLEPNTYEDAVNELHFDNNNALNPEDEGWVVRIWLQLSDDPESRMILREDKDDPSTETRIPLPAGAQFVVDSERLAHAVWHPGPGPRYGLIVSVESGPALQRWIDARLPASTASAGAAR
jgi:hypothetical protein